MTILRRPGASALLFALLAFGLPAAGHALTLSDIETQIRRNVHDTSSDSTLQTYTDSVIDAWINDAQREIVSLTWCIQTSTSYVLTAATTYYAVPTDFIAVVPGKALFLDNGGQQYQLQEFSEAKVYQTDPDFEQTSSGPPTYYFTRFPGDTDDSLEIAYLPVPTATSTGTVTLFYYNRPTDLSSDSDVPFEGFTHLYPYHYGIVYHVVARIKALEQKMEQSTYWMKEFERVVTTMADRLGRAPNRSPSAQGSPR